MTNNRTPYETEAARIHRTYSARYHALMDPIDAAHGWGALTDSPERAEIALRIDDEISAQIAQEIAAIPDELLTEREMLPRRRDRLDAEFEQLGAQMRELENRLVILGRAPRDGDYNAASAEYSRMVDRRSAIIEEKDALFQAEEEAERNDRLDYLAGKLAGEGQNPEELDDFQIFLRAGFLGIDMATRKEIMARLAQRKGVTA